MTKKRLFILTMLSAMLTALWLTIPVTANRLPQQISSPTPDSGGRIVYVVQDNDTCLSIALRFMDGDVNRLIELNNLNDDCLISINQELVLAYQETPVPTEDLTPTPTSNIPTPTPPPGNGIICVMLFDDVNGNGRKDPEELPIVGGAISVTDREGLTSLTGTTVFDGDPETADEIDPLCFDEIPEGDYNISVGPPEGYNATTIMNYPLSLKAGDRSILDFGAQTSSAGAIVAEQGPTEEETRRSPLLGIIGGVMVVIGIGLGIYLQILKR